MAALGIGLGGCAPEVPESCVAMCEAATGVYGDCLVEWELDWPAAGYDDAEAFTASCETWAWEMRVLHRDALRRGLTDERQWLDQTCEERSTTLSSEGVTCEDYTAIDWNEVPW